MSIDTRCCKFCGVEFSLLVDYDGTFDEGYCNKLHRKDHEKQMIASGELVFYDKSMDVAIMKDGEYRDCKGEKIWFPKDGRPYFDKALRRTFNTIKEKHQYMKENKLHMDGSTMPKRLPIEAGDMRNRSYRKSMRLED